MASPAEPSSLDQLLDHQSGVVSRQQANAHGITDNAIAAHVLGGRWQRIHPGTYATFTGPLPRAAQLWAALLYAGADAVLCGPTAAEVDGLIERPREASVHVLVPIHRRVRPQRGIRVHRSRSHAQHGRRAAAPPRTRVEDTVLDLVARATTADQALAIVANACQRRRTTANRLASTVTTRRNLRWRSPVLAALRDIAEGAHSLLEIRYLRDVERRHRLPEGRRQRAVLRGARREWTDVSYDDYATCVELDGRLGHDQVTDAWRDMRRDNRAALAGEVSLRYGWLDVTGRACAVAGEVAEVLRARGWAGQPRRCGNSCCL
ncbi:MAG: hypothetical protein DLM59_11945 [Pseudonocardiales bacterium]|nr:MAG: hypothetical protein DLM59_11945 [Pseudonocardiales bacterium]